jgi:AcrR family transcriptional regulator
MAPCAFRRAKQELSAMNAKVQDDDRAFTEVSREAITRVLSPVRSAIAMTPKSREEPVTAQPGGGGSRTTARAMRNNPAGLAALRDVARREFVASGYHAVSIRDLAREAGVSLSVLYHYYASKQELLYGVLNDAIDAFHLILARGMANVDASEDPTRSLMVLVESTVQYRAMLPAESLLFIREFRSLEPQFAERLADRRDEVGRLFTEAIHNGVRAGVFRTPYPDDARRAIVAMLNGIANWYSTSGPLTVEQLVERYTRLALVIVEFDGDVPAVLAQHQAGDNAHG